MNQVNKRKEHNILESFKNLIELSNIYPLNTDRIEGIDNNGEKSIIVQLKKSSKIIKFIFSYGFMDDYNNFQQNVKQRIDSEIISLLKQHYTEFDSSHNNSYWSNPPIEEKIIKLIPGTLKVVLV